MFAIIVNFTWAWVLRVWAHEFEEFNYRELVRPVDAEKWFAVTPASVEAAKAARESGAEGKIMKLPEFYAEEEASKSLRATWVVAVNERERRRNRRESATRAATARLLPGDDDAQAAEPVRVWTSWIEHTAKDNWGAHERGTTALSIVARAASGAPDGGTGGLGAQLPAA
jgi:hypothetical protein